jgi:hypothetical protein
MTSGLWMGRGRGTLRGRRAPALTIPGRGPHSKRCARGMSGVIGVDAKECRERALRCSELAERATDPSECRAQTACGEVAQIPRHARGAAKGRVTKRLLAGGIAASRGPDLGRTDREGTRRRHSLTSKPTSACFPPRNSTLPACVCRPTRKSMTKKMPTAHLTAPRAALLPDDDRSAVKLDAELEDSREGGAFEDRLRSGLFLIPAAAVSRASRGA